MLWIPNCNNTVGTARGLFVEVVCARIHLSGRTKQHFPIFPLARFNARRSMTELFGRWHFRQVKTSLDAFTGHGSCLPGRSYKRMDDFEILKNSKGRSDPRLRVLSRTQSIHVNRFDARDLEDGSIPNKIQRDLSNSIHF